MELTELLRSWIDEAGPMGERELLVHAVRTLGFRSLGAKIESRLEAALELALERGDLARGGELSRRGS